MKHSTNRRMLSHVRTLAEAVYARGRDAGSTRHVDELATTLLEADWLDHPAIDELIRRVAPRHGFLRRRQVRLQPVIGALGCKVWRELPDVLAAMDPDGPQREAALLRLDPLTASRRDRVLAIMVLRLNDWVPEVRAMARRRVRSAIEAFRSDELIGLLPLFLRLQHLEREDHGPTVARLHRRLGMPDGIEILTARLRQAGQRERRAARWVLTSIQGCPWGAVIETAREDPDVVARIRSIGWAREHLAPTDFEQHVIALTNDPTPAVRGQCLRELASMGTDSATRALEGAMFDRARTVRRISLFYLGKLHPEMDLSGLIRGALDDPAARRRRRAILALADLPAERRDLAEVISDLDRAVERDDDSDLPAALESLTRLAPERGRALLSPFVTDRRPAVRAKAWSLFQPFVLPEEAAWIEAELDRATDQRAARQLLSLVRWLPAIPRLRLILTVDAEPGTQLHLRVHHSLVQWCGQANFARGPREPVEQATLEWIRERLEAMQNELPRGLTARLLECLGVYG